MVLCGVPMVFGAAAYFIVPESVRWLITQGNKCDNNPQERFIIFRIFNVQY